MTDIVGRLRDRSDHYIAQHAMDTMDAAADEIERLRAERDMWHARAVAMFWKLPDDTLCGDLRKDTATALAALKTSK